MTFRTFIARFQFEYLSNVVKDVWRRFPLVLLCCIPACAISMLEAHDVDLVNSSQVLTRLLMFLAYAAVWFAAEKIFAESRGLSRGKHLWLAFTGAAFLALVFFAPREYSAMHGFLAGALGLLLLFSPYIGRQSTEDSVWYYNYCNGIAAAVAAVASGVFCLGLCAVVGSMDYLIYEGKLSKTLYADIWLFGSWIFGPIALLYQVQRKFDFEKNDCFIPKGIYFIANYLAVPLVLIYTWVLYAYVLKIGVTMSLPKGNLAYMVTGFGAAGIAVWLSVYPMRETGTKLLRQFHKYFYYILALPVALLALGIYTRIAEYGVTEERYAIVMALAWLAGLTGYYLFRPKKSHIKHVPMLLCLLCLIASVGPWGAVSVSTWSQQARLESYLVKTGVKQADGSYAKAKPGVSFEDRKEISAILDYMRESRARSAWLVAPFREELRKKYFEERRVYDKNITLEKTEYPDCGTNYYDSCYNNYQLAEHLMAIWGMDYVGRWQTEESENYTVNASSSVSCYSCGGGLMKVAPYDYFIHVSAYISTYNGNNSWDMSAGEGAFAADKVAKIKFTLDTKGHFTAAHADGRKVSFELLPVLEGYRRDGVKSVTEDKAGPLTMRANDGAFAVELRLSELRGRPGADKAIVFEGASMMVLFRE